MDPSVYFTNGLILPETKLLAVNRPHPSSRTLFLHKIPMGAVCTRCATLSNSRHDSRWVKIQDSPVHGVQTILRVKKARYYCKPCKRVFTEPLPGVLPRRKFTQRLRRTIYWACENFTDLKRVSRAYRCSPGFVYQAYYEQLKLREQRHNRYPFPAHIGIDEHAFGRKKGLSRKEFVTMVVDHKNKKTREVVLGKTHAELWAGLEKIPGRENVKLVTLDLSDSYKSFVKGFFTNAQIVADRFHVQRLMNPILHEARIEITGDKRKNPVRILLYKNRINLKSYERTALDKWLQCYPKVKEVYDFKEALGRFYRARGYSRAESILECLINELGKTQNSRLKTLQKTLTRWKTEILNFFKYRLTNARVEGFNNVAKVIKRRAYGFRSFQNYRLRLLNACC